MALIWTLINRLAAALEPPDAVGCHVVMIGYEFWCVVHVKPDDTGLPRSSAAVAPRTGGRYAVESKAVRVY